MATPPPAPSTPARPSRRGYIDWMRGLAVLLMIETHAYDSWLTPEAKALPVHRWIRILGGSPAPLFLFLAGLALGFVAAGRARRGTPPGEVARAGVGRGLEVLGYAALFRLWMFTTGGFTDPHNLLRADVLNCIGLSMAITAAVALPWRSTSSRIVAALALTSAVVLLTPLVWNDATIRGLPEPIRAYLGGRGGLAFFPLFPWAAFTSLGVGTGLALGAGVARGRETVAVGALAAAGLGLVALGLGLDRLPPVYAAHDFWRTSPSFFWIRAGVLLLVVGLAFVWEQAPWGRWPSALRQMGRTSLLIYWAHIEVVYGGIFTFWAHHRLSLAQATTGWVLVAFLMLALSRWRTHGWRSLLPGRPESPAAG
jgi:uncharacterized membrane protein